MAITIILFIVASIFTAALLKMISGIKNNFMIALFTALMLVFPTNAFIFEFILATVLTSLGYILSIFAVVYTIHFILEKKIKSSLVVISLLVFAISSYESFIFVYFTMILFFILFSLRINSRFKTQSIIKFLLYVCILIIVSTLIESLVSNLLIYILDLEKINRVAISESMWFKSPSMYTIKRLIFNIFINYFFIGLLDFSHMYYVLIVFFMFVATFFVSDRKYLLRSILIIILINISVYGITVVEGKVQLARTMQTFSTFVMFGSGYVYIALCKKWIKKTFIIVVSFAIYSSVHLQNLYYEREWKNHLKQENFLNTLMHDVEYQYGSGQNVYFIGKYDAEQKWYDDSVLQITKDSYPGKIFNYINKRFYDSKLTNEGSDYYAYAYYSSSVLIDVFGDYAKTEHKQEYFIRYIIYLGYDVNSCDIEYLDEAEEKDMAKDMNYYPQNGYIKEQDGCIFVNIGQNSIDE